VQVVILELWKTKTKQKNREQLLQVWSAVLVYIKKQKGASGYARKD
jgi:hypothetical protein